jgi:carbonic anhydrase
MACLFAVLFCPCSLPALAVDNGELPDAPAAKEAAAPAPVASVPLPAPAQMRKGLEDPMDRLRERLAAKFGGAGALATSEPGAVRVVNRDSSGHAASAPAAVASSAPAVARSTANVQRERKSASAAAPTPARHVEWSYDGAGGPEHWAELKPEFATCARGTRQSPIDIRDGIKVELDPVQFDYRPATFRVIDNGHTVRVEVGAGNAIDVLGRHYELIEFHFHRPSEERVDGQAFAMVAHLVHKAADGRLAVVAVLLEPGRAQPVVQSVWNNLPLDKGEEVTPKVSIDLSGLLPEDRRYYTYMGSLTTPPCSEGVLWMVMRKPVTLSPEQIGVFARLYPMNARPIQQASGRLIKESD